MLTDSLTEPARDITATAGVVAQLTGHITAAAFYITGIFTDLTSPQLTDAQMQ